MGVFSKYPYTDFNNLNLDWVISIVKENDGNVDSLRKWAADHEADYNELKRQVDGLIQNMTRPVEPWDGTKEYTRYTLVSYDGDTYIALKDVPAGVLITNTEYWDEAQTVQTELNAIKADIIELEITRCKTYQTTEEMIDDFTAEDIVCCVLNAAIPLDPLTTLENYGITYFEYASTAPWVYEIALENGGYAVMMMKDFTPIKGNDALEILPRILEIGYSYCAVDRTPQFNTPDGYVGNVTYQSQMGPFATDPAAANGMQCSQFINAVLRGVPYEMSKLADFNNANFEDPQGAGQLLKVNGNDYYFSAQQLAHFCAAKGWFKASHNLNDCEIGDIVFVGNSDPENGLLELDWRGIGHCAIVVGKGRDIIMVMQCGSIASVAGFGMIRRRPGYATDGVNFNCIGGTNNPFEDTDGYYGMKGFARIPLYYTKLVPSEHTEGELAATSYAAAAANASYYPVRYSDTVNALFGIMQWKGHTSRVSNRCGILLGSTVENTVYDADGTYAGHATIPQTNYTGAIVINCDGVTSPVQLTWTRRSSASTAGSDCAAEIVIDLFKRKAT